MATSADIYQINDFDGLLKGYARNAEELLRAEQNHKEFTRKILLSVRTQLEDMFPDKQHIYIQKSTGKLGVFVIDGYGSYGTKFLAFCPKAEKGYSIKPEDITAYAMQILQLTNERQTRAVFVFKEGDKLEAVEAKDMAQRLSELYVPIDKEK